MTEGILYWMDGPWHDPPTVANAFTFNPNAFARKAGYSTLQTHWSTLGVTYFPGMTAIEQLFRYIDQAIFWHDIWQHATHGPGNWATTIGYRYADNYEVNNHNGSLNLSVGDAGYLYPGPVKYVNGADVYTNERYYIDSSVFLDSAGNPTTLDIWYKQRVQDQFGFKTTMVVNGLTDRHHSQDNLDRNSPVLECWAPQPIHQEILDAQGDDPFPDAMRPCSLLQLQNFASSLVVAEHAPP